MRGAKPCDRRHGRLHGAGASDGRSMTRWALQCHQTGRLSSTTKLVNDAADLMLIENFR
jgi:hypothetical protein